MGALRAGAKNNTLIELERTMAIGFDEERRFNIDNLMKLVKPQCFEIFVKKLFFSFKYNQFFV